MVIMLLVSMTNYSFLELSAPNLRQEDKLSLKKNPTDDLININNFYILLNKIIGVEDV